MTKQTIFNKVVRFLRQQNAKSLSAGSCQYRGADGKKCAAGCLIPNKKYSPKMENTFAGGVLKVMPELHPHEVFIVKLVRIHDYNDPPQWESKWQELALTYDLTMPN